MIDNSKEYILCAAIWYDDGISEDPNLKTEITFPMHGKGRTFTNKNISTGFVIGGFRHGNCIAIRPTNPKYNGGMEPVQGFLTSEGRFVDRWQGMYLAWQSGQVHYTRAFSKTYNGNKTNFDYEKLLNSVPRDDRFYETPLNMLYSEDLY